MNLKNETEPVVSIIILNYNSGDLLKNCIASILLSDYKNFEIIVVDNKSEDNSQNFCKEQYPQIKLIQNSKNLGYCEGNNVGIDSAKGEFIVLLNPDTTVEKKWLMQLLEAYNEKGDALFQPKLLVMDEPTKINSAGNMIHIFGFGYSRGKGEKDNIEFNKSLQIGYASGACLFTSKKILEKIGNLDPLLWAYHDDLELGWRALKQGINSYYIPNAIVYHKESSSFKWSKMKFFLLERNRHYCLLTQYSKKTFYKILPYLTITEIIIFFYYLKKGLIVEKIKAYADIIKNRKKILQKYNELEKIRKVEDTQIIDNFQDEIFVPIEVTSSRTNNLFNQIIGKLAKKARKSISK